MRTCLSLMLCFGLFAASHTVLAAQTCVATIPASTSDEQLTDNNDGTITDSRTKLMWKKCLEGVSGEDCDGDPATSFTWQGALLQPGSVNGSGGFAGYSDWRLPNIKELISIVEESCSAPAINLSRFPNTPISYVWSASPNIGFPKNAWYVDFDDGASIDRGPRGDIFQVRLVRDVP